MPVRFLRFVDLIWRTPRGERNCGFGNADGDTPLRDPFSRSDGIPGQPLTEALISQQIAQVYV